MVRFFRRRGTKEICLAASSCDHSVLLPLGTSIISITPDELALKGG